MRALRSQVQSIQSSSSANLDSLHGLTRFFLQHESGKALLAMAAEKVHGGEAEEEFQLTREAFTAALEDLRSAAGKVVDVRSPSQGVHTVCDQVRPAVNALLAMKQCQFLKSKVFSPLAALLRCTARISKVSGHRDWGLAQKSELRWAVVTLKTQVQDFVGSFVFVCVRSFIRP